MSTPADLHDPEPGNDIGAERLAPGIDLEFDHELELGPGHAPLIDPLHDVPGRPRPLLTAYARAAGPDHTCVESALSAVVGRYDLTATRRAAGPAGYPHKDGPVGGQVHGCGLGSLSLAWACYDTAVTITVQPPLGYLIVCLPSAAITDPAQTGPARTGSAGAPTAAATVIGPASEFGRRTLTLAAHEALLAIRVPALPLFKRWRQMPGGGDLDPLHLRLPEPLPVPRLARAAGYVCGEADWLANEQSPRAPLTSVPMLDGASLENRIVDALLIDVDTAIGIPNAAPVRTVSVNPRLAGDALAWLREYHHLPVTVGDLATAMNVSGRHIQAVVAATLGLTVARVLRGIRLDAARELLQSEPDTAVGEIARRVGIPHCGRFSEYYRQRFGTSPGAAS